MKKILIIAVLAVLPAMSFPQVFNSAGTLGPGRFVLGANPAVLSDGSPSDGLNLFLHGGVGLKPGVDLALKFGVGHTNYIGADLEWGLGRLLSLTTGLHNFGHFGLDASVNFSLPIRSDTYIYSGIDMDLIFASELRAPFWIPVGIELGLRRNLSFVLEGEIGLNPEAYHIIDLGLNLYF